MPAFQAKDLALALDEHKNELTPERRKVAEPAIAKLVRAAYLLDAFGDIGNKQQISRHTPNSSKPKPISTASFPPVRQAAIRNDDQRLRDLVVSAIVLAGVAAGDSAGRRAQGDHLEYTYNDDVFPILRDRCASCHVPGGIAPMSLMTYDDAFPWAESIRAELVAAHMPPWNADEGYGEIKRAHTLTPEGARRHPDLGDRRQPARRARSEAARRSRSRTSGSSAPRIWR